MMIVESSRKFSGRNASVTVMGALEAAWQQGLSLACHSPALAAGLQKTNIFSMLNGQTVTCERLGQIPAFTALVFVAMSSIESAQTSVRSASSNASSMSTPKYRTVLSILAWPRRI